MVKNKTGGSRHKKQARKNVNAPVSSKLRLANEEGEIYAKVIKLCGNGMADVLCNDKVVRLLIIRKKFKGRHKRDNTISVNTLLLVGRRLWEVVAEKKKQKVDLLCVYSMSQIEQLKKRATINIDLLPKHVQIEDDCGGFEITSKHDWKNELQQMEETNTKVSNTNVSNAKARNTNIKVSNTDTGNTGNTGHTGAAKTTPTKSLNLDFGDIDFDDI